MFAPITPRLTCKLFSSLHVLLDRFRIKDVIPRCLKSRVIYSFSCSGCNARYIGKTTRHFKTRVFEHMGVSARTHKALQCPPFSAVREHCNLSGHSLEMDHFDIIRSANNTYDLNIMENLEITLQKPSLNTQLDCTLKLF